MLLRFAIRSFVFRVTFTLEINLREELVFGYLGDAQLVSFTAHLDVHRKSKITVQGRTCV